ncbi:hypothetical protein ACVDG5_009890 [Mesorhizobium sp. ORM6]
MLDFSSLLLAAALSGICLSVTMFAIWFTAPRAGFVLTVACGIFVLVAHVILFWRYTRSPIRCFARSRLPCSTSAS